MAHHHSEFALERILAQRDASVSVCLPARDEAATIGPILESVMRLAAAGAVDQVVVVDDSSDATAEIARAGGAEVHRQCDLRADAGPVLGKGDAMWRALEVLRGDVVVYVDADSRDFGDHFVRGLMGPLVCAAEVSFVKGFYRRPFDSGPGMRQAEGGGRVTELTARPLLAAFYPELAPVRQPLAGEIGARRELLDALPFTTGYGVDIGLLIDACERCGIQGLAQVDLDQRQNRHRSLSELAPMAAAVTDAIVSRLDTDGRLVDRPDRAALAGLMPPAVVRPPAASLRPVAA
ncbi:MAG: glucosyl-3-phosphoglycerate synthase [Actinomycetota bacterium]|nr:glucosyl-3-phosphoglycerate synthase [Actinomycetota bacterium]